MYCITLSPKSLTRNKMLGVEGNSQKENPDKNPQPVLPPEYPVTKPQVQPEKERSEPFRPVPEIQPVPKPEIKPEKS